jgi:hypothetical protein
MSDQNKIRKIAGYVTIPRYDALIHGIVEPTPEERAKQEAWRIEYAQRKQAATEAMPVFVAQLAAVIDPVARAVLDLHEPHTWGCAGCDFSGYDGEAPEWPCRTVEAVAAALGITVPPDLDMVTWP